MLKRVWRRGNCPTLLVGMQTGANTRENSMEFPLKTKNRVTVWSGNPTPGHISRKNENTNSKRYMHPSVHNRTIYNSQDMRKHKYPLTNEWIKKMWYIHRFSRSVSSYLKLGFWLNVSKTPSISNCMWIYAYSWIQANLILSVTISAFSVWLVIGREIPTTPK